MSCASPYRAGGFGSQAIFTAGTNNTEAGTSTLTAPTAGVTLTNQVLTFINGANENAVTPTAPTYGFFQTTTYIGAVQNAADTWYQGWTCGLTAGKTC